LNTNAVVILNKEGKEIIVTGAGLGFKKRPGDEIEQDKVDKTYILEDPELNHRLQEIIKSVSADFLEVADQIIRVAKREYELEVSEVLYITLTDHISSSLERYKKGQSLKNTMLWDIERIYQNEFSVGKKAVELVEQKTGVNLGDDEAGFIAMHIVMASINTDLENVTSITKLVNGILQIVHLHYGINYKKSSIAYQRFVTHLKFFSVRIIENSFYEESMAELYVAFVNQNRELLEVLDKIAAFIKEEFDYEIGIDEKLYLMIHIKRILAEHQ